MTQNKIDTGSELLLCSLTDGVATLTLNNPERRNALSGDLPQALGRMLALLDDDARARVLVLTGAGGAFCAGGDISSMGAALGDGAQPDPDAMTRRLRQAQDDIALRLARLSKPSIAALPGAAAGAGMSLALACDLRVSGQSGYLLPAFGGIGLSGDFGGSWLLARLIGPARAKEAYFTNRRIMAEEALALGLVNRVVADADVLGEAQALAAQIAGHAPMALRYMKENIDRAGDTDLRQALDIEADRMIRTLLSDDHREGARAFAEKRKPAFGGR